MNFQIPKSQISSTLPKGVKLFFILEPSNEYVIKGKQTMAAWYGDSEGHKKAGRAGGLKNGGKKNKVNFANDKEKARRAGRKSKRKKLYSFDK